MAQTGCTLNRLYLVVDPALTATDAIAMTVRSSSTSSGFSGAWLSCTVNCARYDL